MYLWRNLWQQILQELKKLLETAEIAKQKKLNVVVGLQRHYQNSYRELYKRVKDGMIGEITSARCGGTTMEYG